MFTDPPITAPSVDLGRFLGRWFEIARLPNQRQSEDCTDIAADYALDGNGNLHVTHRCIQFGGSPRTDDGVVTVDGDDPARLRVSFMHERLRWLPFTRQDHWILRLDPEYTLVLVGSRNRRLLWLLSRSRFPDTTLRDEFLAHAEGLGYDLTALIHTSQDRKRGSLGDAPPSRKSTREVQPVKVRSKPEARPPRQ